MVNTFKFRFKVFQSQNKITNGLETETYQTNCSILKNLSLKLRNDDFQPVPFHFKMLPGYWKTFFSIQEPWIITKQSLINFNAISQVAIYTSFAITGNPNNAVISDVSWEPVTSVELPLNCLNISEKKLEMIPLPETERLIVWDSVYNDEGVALY